MPDYIVCCMNTWKVPYTLLTYDNLREYTDMDVERVKRFTLPQIADCVRVHVLRDQGGYWLDTDTIMVTGKLPEETVFGDPDLRTNTIGMLHTEPHSDMFIKWARYQDSVISGADTPTHWAVMGNAFTDAYVRKHDVTIGQIRNRWPETYMFGGTIPRYEKYRQFYFESGYKLSDIEPTDLLMLHNSWTPGWYKDMPAREVMNHGCTLSNILRELL